MGEEHKIQDHRKKQDYVRMESQKTESNMLDGLNVGTVEVAPEKDGKVGKKPKNCALNQLKSLNNVLTIIIMKLL